MNPSAIWRYAHRAASIALLCAAYAGPADAQQLTALEREGQALLTKFCSACHAVNRSGASPHFRAPPFRVISQRYDVADLIEQLQEGFTAPHPDMPTFKFSRQGLEQRGPTSTPFKSSAALPDGQDKKHQRSIALRPATPDENLMRGVHFLSEYAEVEDRLKAWGIASTVVVFGSARIGAAVGDALDQGKRASGWYDQARSLARIVSERGGALSPINGLRQNVIATGGGPGIMEAANRGASDAGAPSIGFNISLPTQQAPNVYSTPELTFQFHYFAMRKMHLAMRAAALVVFPGGFGTLDELFEVLNLMQTGKGQSIPIICFDQSYWHGVINFEAMIDAGVIARDDLRLFEFADDAELAWQAMLAHGLKPAADAIRS